MSTRATYQFSTNNGYSPTTTLYVHHDGYPTGASSYFYDTLIGGHDGTLVEQFLRSVPRSEITKSHKFHSDTEYRYTVTGDGPGANLVAESVSGWDEPRRTTTIYDGTLAAFVDQFRPAFGHGSEAFEPFRPVTFPYQKQPTYLNKATALALIEERESPSGRMRGSNLATLRIWAAKDRGEPINPRTHGNWRSVSERVRLIAEAFELTEPLAELDALEASLLEALPS